MCDCDRALELISLELDEMLGDRDREELEAHMAACPQCGAIARELLAVRRIMPQLEEEVPEGFRQRVMGKIAAETVVSFPQKKNSSGWKRWVPMAAAFALIIAGAGTAIRWEDLTGQLAGGMNTPATVQSVDASQEPVAATGGTKETAGIMMADMEDQPSNIAVEPVATPEAMPTVPPVLPEEAAPEMKVRAVPDPITTPTITPTATPIAAPAATTALVVPTEPPMGMLRSAVVDLPAPTATPPAEGQMLMSTYGLPPTFSIEDAGKLVLDRAYSGFAYETVRKDDGAFSGYQISGGDSVLELNYMGLSTNGLYYEFTLLPKGGTEEWNRFAVKLDGEETVALWETGTETGPVEHQTEYDAAVGNG